MNLKPVKAHYEGQTTYKIDPRRWVVSRPNARQSSAIQTHKKPGTVTVSGNMGLDVPKGRLNSVLKQAGLK